MKKVKQIEEPPLRVDYEYYAELRLPASQGSSESSGISWDLRASPAEAPISSGAKAGLKKHITHISPH